MKVVRSKKSTALIFFFILVFNLILNPLVQAEPFKVDYVPYMDTLFSDYTLSYEGTADGMRVINGSGEETFSLSSYDMDSVISFDTLPDYYALGYSSIDLLLIPSTTPLDEDSLKNAPRYYLKSLSINKSSSVTTTADGDRIVSNIYEFAKLDFISGSIPAGSYKLMLLFLDSMNMSGIMLCSLDDLILIDGADVTEDDSVTVTTPADSTDQIAPSVIISIPSLNTSGSATLNIYPLVGSPYESSLELTGEAMMYSSDIMFNDGEVIRKVELLAGSDVLARWSGVTVLKSSSTTTISLRPQIEGRTVDTTVMLAGTEFTGPGMKVNYYPVGSLEPIGTAPCKLVPGETVMVKVEPDINHSDLKYAYRFPASYADYYRTVVPETGNIIVPIEGFDRNTVLSGRITDAADSSIPVAGAHISVSQAYLSEEGNNTSVSVMGISDEEGYYSVFGLYKDTAAAINITHEFYEGAEAKLDAHQVSDKAFYDASMNAINSYLDIHTTLAETSDTGSYAEAIKQKDFYISYNVKDNNGLSIMGQSKEIYHPTDIASYRFIPYSQNDFIPGSTINIDIDAIDAVPVSASTQISPDQKTETDITIVPHGAAVFRAISGSDNILGCSAYLFRDDYSLAGVSAFAAKSVADEDNYVYAPEGTYTLIVINDSLCTGNITSMENIHEAFTPENYVMLPDITITNNQGTYLSSDNNVITVPEINEFYNSIAEPASWITTPPKHDGSSLLKLNGHIETRYDDKSASVRKLYVSLHSTSGAFIPATIPNSCLTVNNKSVSANPIPHDIIPNNLVFTISEEVTPFDFSFYILPTNDAAIEVEVLADIVVDGVEYERQIIGSSTIEGKQLTIKGSTRAAQSAIEFTGTAPDNKEVILYDGNAIIGSAISDDKGNWSLYATLSNTFKDYPTTHRIKAVCDNESSDTISLRHDAEGAALKSLTIGYESGDSKYEHDMNSYYQWSAGLEYYCTAYFDNGERLHGDVIFYITCSNGDVIALKGKKLNDDTYQTEPYPFGSKNMVPIKAWVKYESGTPDILPVWAEDENTLGTPYLMAASSLNYASSKADSSQNNSVRDRLERAGYVIEEGSSDGSLPEEGKFIIDYHYENMSVRDIKKSVDKSFKKHVIYKDNGEILHDTYTRYTALGNTYTYTLYYVSYAEDRDGVGCMISYTYKESDNRIAGSTPSDIQASSISSMSVKQKKNNSHDYLVSGGIEISKQYNAVANNMPGATTAGIIANLDSVNTALDMDADVTEWLSYYDYMEYSLPLLKSRGYDTTKLENAIRVGRNSCLTVQRLNIDTMTSTLAGTSAVELMDLIDKSQVVTLGLNFIISYGCMAQDADTDVVYRGAYGELLEASLIFQQTTGISRADFLRVYREWVHLKQQGNSSSSDEDILEFIWHFLPKIDPSGYIYEAVASNRLEGAKVSLYEELDGTPTYWDAASYDNQVNPLISNIEGRYAWDVPEGNWFVTASLDGYEDNTSNQDPAATVVVNNINWLPVLPPQLDVNIGLTSYEAPMVIGTSSQDHTIGITYSKYMYPDSVASALTVYLDGNELILDDDYTLAAVNEEISPAHTPICGGQTLASVYEIHIKAPINEESRLYFITDTSALSYSNTLAEAFESEEFVIYPETDSEVTETKAKQNWPIIIAAAVVLVIAVIGGLLIYKNKKSLNK